MSSPLLITAPRYFGLQKFICAFSEGLNAVTLQFKIKFRFIKSGSVTHWEWSEFPASHYCPEIFRFTKIYLCVLGSDKCRCFSVQNKVSIHKIKASETSVSMRCESKHPFQLLLVDGKFTIKFIDPKLLGKWKKKLKPQRGILCVILWKLFEEFGSWKIPV